jgi:hypothetical protein
VEYVTSGVQAPRYNCKELKEKYCSIELKLYVGRVPTFSDVVDDDDNNNNNLRVKAGVLL